MDDFLGFEVDDGDAEILVEDVRDRALPGKYDRLSRLIESSYGPDGLVGASVDDGESVVDLIAGVKASTVRAEGRPVRIPSDRHRRANGVRLQIDHRDRVGATVGGIQGRVVVGDGDGADAIETDDLTDGFEGCRLDYRDLVAGEVGDKESSAGVIELDSLAGLGKAGFEIGNSSTEATLTELLPKIFPADFSSSNLNVGSSLPDRSGSGTLFMNFGSPMASSPEK